jgi:hypothetical protein
VFEHRNLPERARAYLAKMPPAISGQGGHRATYHAAVVLVKGFALDDDSVARLLDEWNQSQCQPPWSESELRHKLREAVKSPRPHGYLLGEAVPPRPSPAMDASGSESARKARQRAAWPRLRSPSGADARVIAAQRRLPLAAVDLCARAGFIRVATVDGHRAYLIAEGRFIQARRMDGQPFTRQGGQKIKARNLPGSEGAFIGQKWLGLSLPILLVEGAIGLLEATAAIILAGRTDWTCLAATSAGSRFYRDEPLLARLRGRQVRILPDADDAGLDGAAAWLATLEGAGARVDSRALPAGCKDLGELIARSDRHTETLRQLFAP